MSYGNILLGWYVLIIIIIINKTVPYCVSWACLELTVLPRLSGSVAILLAQFTKIMD